MTRDCKATFAATTQGDPMAQLRTVTCFECGRQGHFKKDCPKLKKQSRGKKAANSKACGRAYALGGGERNQDSNVVTGTFLLNNRYASMLLIREWIGYQSTICDEKVIRIHYDNKVLMIHGDGSDKRSKSKLGIISCTQMQKYIQKGCYVFFAQITNKKDNDKPKEKRLEDVPILRDFPEVFPEDLPGLPPTQEA
ncbi:putative reverse transcriptase domain-containing protein [Tanacetum coccineum]|uniref:Reverse transcriptase domain-containing protein n=1 Tax=Tanacetum coccineum TaxID=301880 RepID=A0ABQ5CMU5_9ASTR